MDYAEFKQMKVSAPMYGTAPAAIVHEHQEIVREMERLFTSGVSLQSDEFWALKERANELENKITLYNETTDDVE